MLKYLLEPEKMTQEEMSFMSSKIRPEFNKFFSRDKWLFLADSTLSRGYIEINRGYDYSKETLLHLLVLSMIRLTNGYLLTAKICDELTGENFFNWKDSVFGLFSVYKEALFKLDKNEEKFFKENASISDVDCLIVDKAIMWKKFYEDTKEMTFHFDNVFIKNFKEKFRLSATLKTYTENYLYMNSLMTENEVGLLYRRYEVEVLNNPFNSKILEKHSLMIKQISEMFRFLMMDKFFDFEQSKRIILNQLKSSVSVKKDFYIKSLEPIDYQTFLESQFFFFKSVSNDFSPEELLNSELNKQIERILNNEAIFESYESFANWCKNRFGRLGGAVFKKYAKDYVEVKVDKEKEWTEKELLEEIRQDETVKTDADIKSKLEMLVRISKGKKQEAYNELLKKYSYSDIQIDF